MVVRIIPGEPANPFVVSRSGVFRKTVSNHTPSSPPAHGEPPQRPGLHPLVGETAEPAPSLPRESGVPRPKSGEGSAAQHAPRSQSRSWSPSAQVPGAPCRTTSLRPRRPLAEGAVSQTRSVFRATRIRGPHPFVVSRPGVRRRGVSNHTPSTQPSQPIPLPSPRTPLPSAVSPTSICLQSNRAGVGGLLSPCRLIGGLRSPLVRRTRWTPAPRWMLEPF